MMCITSASRIKNKYAHRYCTIVVETRAEIGGERDAVDGRMHIIVEPSTMYVVLYYLMYGTGMVTYRSSHI